MGDNMNLRDIEYIAKAHTDLATKPSKSVRKWNEKTPYCIHPFWCAATLTTETTLDERTREEGVQALLYHDILEDTIAELPEELPERVKQLVQDMTFESSQEEIKEIWSKPKEILLYKLYDKVSNLLDGSWMDEEKRAKYTQYTRFLCARVEEEYGALNITKIARAITGDYALLTDFMEDGK